MSAMRTATPAHAQAAGDGLPAGPEKAIVERSCTACHGLDNITGKRASEQEWNDTVNTMVSRGADLTDAEIPKVVKYLAKSFPPPGQAGATTPSTSGGDAAPAAPAKTDK